MTKTPTPASHAVNTAPISADLRGIDDVGLRSAIGPLINAFGEAQWQSGRGVPHPDLEEAFEAIIAVAQAHALRAVPASPAQQDAPAAQPARECLQQSVEGVTYPPLPEPVADWVTRGSVSVGGGSYGHEVAREGLFTAEQMRAYADAALQAAPPAPEAVAVPAKALPYEPTSDMLTAARACDPALPIDIIRAIYWAMYRAAAPAQAVAVPDDAVAAALIRLDAIYQEEADDGEFRPRPDWLVTALRLASRPAQEHATQLAGQGQEEVLRGLLNRRPAMNAGLAQEYALWNAECYRVMGAQTKASANDGQAQEDAVRALIAKHAELLEESEYTYFELAYTRQTGWMAWITDKPFSGPVLNPDRKVLARGQGDTPDEACADAARAAQGGA